ncbi:MAG: large conductance mechanosensitive channel protein MscL [Rhodoglobus sp.]
MLKGFKEFILRGNVIDLAVAVVIGTAFTAIVSAIVDGVINPAIGALFNASDLAKAFPVVIPTLSGGEPAIIYFGAVLAAVINFLLVAFVVYFGLIVPVNVLKKRADARKAAGGEVVETPVEAEVALLTEIRDLLAKPVGGGSHSES